MNVRAILAAAMASLVVGCTRAEQPSPEATPEAPKTEPAPAAPEAEPQPAEAYDGPVYSPYVEQSFPTRVFWGDTHLHTAISLDAYSDGVTKNGPDEAYRWAKGEVLAGDNGVPTRISKPLDFLAVTDHAEYLGYIKGLADGDESLRSTEAGARWGKMIDEGDMVGLFGEFIPDVTSNKQSFSVPEFEDKVWKDMATAADAHYEPGKFTTFTGYEYSPFPDGDNLHRVVIFRDGADKVTQVRPFSAFDSENPEDLWSYLEAYEAKSGGKVMAIPHNPNLSGGNMFALQDFNGNPLTREYAERRMRWEPILEVTQYKGDSEAHPDLSPDDEFADFEGWDRGNLAMLKATTPEHLPFNYARPALKNGLALEAKLGANPFKFGMIGATDSHTSFAASAEDNFLGKYGTDSPSPERWKKKFPPATVPGLIGQIAEWETASSGYAAVWATENTREAIFAAMMRKEVYATSGPRMVVRAFGGFDFTADDVHRHDVARIGYEKGVPMGGDLSKAPEGKGFTMLVTAAKDPDGANLDRVQIVKGWIDAKSELHEHIYDAAVSDSRKIAANGRCKKDVGSTVDLKTATYRNSIGDAFLSAAWTDPDFNPAVRSFYYVRVIEIPTPRWPAFDAVRFGVEMSEEVRMVIRERAYTSPIWYTP